MSRLNSGRWGEICGATMGMEQESDDGNNRSSRTIERG